MIISVINLTGAKLNPGIDIGYYNGPGFSLYITSDSIPSKKTTGRFSLGISFPYPGNPVLARKVFINDATNGIPHGKGRSYNFGFDLIKKLRLKIYPKSKFFFGIRYSMFRAMFKYTGGNEEFTITSNNFGIGVGTDYYFKLTRKRSLKISTGIDYFFKARIHGHDTTYYPDNQNINPRRSYGFSDADSSVNQPDIEFKIVFGLTAKR